MRLTTLLLMTLASVALSEPVPEDALTEAAAACGWPNGNCYENDCHGERSPDRVTCTTGPYNGCQCGYNCGKNTGSCYENGCEGRNGRCTGAYLGCSCL